MRICVVNTIMCCQEYPSEMKDLCPQLLGVQLAASLYLSALFGDCLN